MLSGCGRPMGRGIPGTPIRYWKHSREFPSEVVVGLVNVQKFGRDAKILRAAGANQQRISPAKTRLLAFGNAQILRRDSSRRWTLPDPERVRS